LSTLKQHTWRDRCKEDATDAAADEPGRPTDRETDEWTDIAQTQRSRDMVNVIDPRQCPTAAVHAASDKRSPLNCL